MSDKRPANERTTVRMRVAPDMTLHGYIFADDEHARLWLATRGDLSKVHLERVVVGDWRPCPRCRGDGYVQSVRVIEDVDVDQFLAKGVA